MQQFLILKYLNVEGGVSFWEIIKIRLDNGEKNLTNLQKILVKRVKTSKQASKASIKSAKNGFSSLTNCNLQANVSRKYV